MSRASESYLVLGNAMAETFTPCRGDNRFTADLLTPTDKTALKAICDTCLLFDQCHTYADLARPPAGFWAGKTYGNHPKKETS